MGVSHVSTTEEWAGRAPRPEISLALPTTGPFNLEATVRLLQRRPTNRVDRWSDGTYCRAVRTADGLRLLQVTNQGTLLEPDLHLVIFGGNVTRDAAALLAAMTRRILGLDEAPAPLAWMVDVEPRLASIAHVLHGFRSPCFPTLFETIASVLPFQQLSLDAGTAIVGRIVESFGESIVVGDLPWFSFPRPEPIAAAETSQIRATGLSMVKASSLGQIARAVATGDLDENLLRDLPTPDALRVLRTLPGIGPWSANLVLLRGMRRLDVFPVGDIGAARNLTALIEPASPFTPATASDFAARFGDQRGYLYFIALGAQLYKRGLLGTDA